VKDYEKTKDQLLVEKFLNEKDHKAYQVLYYRYYNAIKNLVGRITKNDIYKDDLTQEVFIKVFKNLATYNPHYNFLNWIYKIATITTIDFIKKKNKINIESIEKLNQEGEIFTSTVPY